MGEFNCGVGVLDTFPELLYEFLGEWRLHRSGGLGELYVLLAVVLAEGKSSDFMRLNGVHFARKCEVNGKTTYAKFS